MIVIYLFYFIYILIRYILYYIKKIKTYDIKKIERGTKKVIRNVRNTYTCNNTRKISRPGVIHVHKFYLFFIPVR